MVLSLLGGDFLGDAVVVSSHEGDLATEGCVLSDPTLLGWIGQEVAWRDDDGALFVFEVLDDRRSISHVIIWHLHACFLDLGVGPVLLVACSLDGTHVCLSRDGISWVLIELVTILGWSTEENLVDISLLSTRCHDVSWLDNNRAVFWISVGYNHTSS